VAAGDMRPNGGVNVTAVLPRDRARPEARQLDNAIQRLAKGHEAELARLAAAHAAELGRIRADLDHERAERRAEAERATKERAALTTALSDALQPWWRRLRRPR
jgi:predicted  nucleic acid-binding Zn-ribbon protein